MTGSILGNRVLRREDPKFLTTGAVYLADLDEPLLEGALYVTYVRSTMAHATIVGIDTSEAEGMPGVVAVHTAASLGLEPAPATFNPMVTRTMLASDKVRYVGEPIAAVITHDRAQGADAAEAVVVDYEPLDVLVDMEEAAASSTLIYEGAGSNVVFDSTALGMPGLGGDELFEGCDVVVSERIVNQRVAPCPMEPRAAAATWVDGRLYQWVSTQHAHGAREAVKAANGLDEGGVRVITPDVGGGFGAKITSYPEELLLGRISREHGQPVDLARDPQRVDGQPLPRPGPGAAGHHRRDARRQGAGLPAARLPGRRRLGRHGHDPRPVHDQADVVGRLRHPHHRVPDHLGGHQHRAHHRLPRRRPARGHRGHRTGHGPLRRRARPRPGRRPPHQPDRRLRRAAHHGHRPDLRRRRTTPRRSTGCSRPPATPSCAPSRPAGASPATPCSSASA